MPGVANSNASMDQGNIKELNRQSIKATGAGGGLKKKTQQIHLKEFKSNYEQLQQNISAVMWKQTSSNRNRGLGGL